MDTAALLWNVLFGSIGFAYFIYGKKRNATVPLVCGLVLLVLPYLVSNDILLALIGLSLVAAPFLIRF